MKVNININYEKIVFTCGIDNLEYSDKFFASNRSEYLYNKIKEEFGLEKTIKDGIIYDSKLLLEDVKRIVEDEKLNTPGWEKLLYEYIERN